MRWRGLCYYIICMHIYIYILLFVSIQQMGFPKGALDGTYFFPLLNFPPPLGPLNYSNVRYKSCYASWGGIKWRESYYPYDCIYICNISFLIQAIRFPEGAFDRTHFFQLFTLSPPSFGAFELYQCYIYKYIIILYFGQNKVERVI